MVNQTVGLEKITGVVSVVQEILFAKKPKWDRPGVMILMCDPADLLADLQLSKIYYGRREYYAKTDDADVITPNNTAWSIAGEDYDSQTTVYKFPDGHIYTGDQISDKIGWDRIPAKTVVLLNQENSIPLIKSDNPIKTISDNLTAWSFAGQAYHLKTTIYFLPSGRIKNRFNDIRLG